MASLRALSIAGLNGWLRSTHEHYLSAAARPAHVAACLGNEACDLDSATSALVRAYSLSSPAAPVLAVLNMPRSELSLRTELVHHLAACGVDSAHLVFADSVALGDWAQRGHLTLHLVDHNKLAPSQAAWEPYVASIVDHHLDEGACPNASPRHIAFPTGSCCSLLADLVLRDATLDAGMARLLLGVILLDTGNLDAALGKTEPIDSAMCKRLAQVAALDDAARHSFWAALNEAKFDVRSLSALDLLRKDFKEFELGGKRVGMSSVVVALSDWATRPQPAAALEQWTMTRGLDLLVVMAGFYDQHKRYARELLVCAPVAHGALVRACAGHLAQPQLGLQLSPARVLEAPPALEVAAFTQGNAHASRKQVQPMLADFFANTANL